MYELDFENIPPEEIAADQAWMRQNMHLFAPLAREGFAQKGRGAITANVAELMLRLHSAEGHAFNYHAAPGAWLETANAFMPASERVRLTAWLQEYIPDSELLILLYKFERVLPYRLSFPLPEDLDDEMRGAYVQAEAEERQQRLACSDFWARDFRLASPYLFFWKEQMEK